MSEPTQRYTDHIEFASDHDILIKLNTKISTVCHAQVETNDHLKDFIDKIDDRCEIRLGIVNDINNKAVGKAMFTWIIGIIISVLIIIFGICGMNKVDITKYQTMMDSNVEQIGLNAIAIKKLIINKKVQ